MKTIRIGTRKSRLALSQTEFVAESIRSRYPNWDVQLVKITTTGDKIKEAPLAMVGGKGLFVKEIEEALLRGEIDLAVHSLKDMPAELPEGLEIVCYPRRADPRDALISLEPWGIMDLPRNATVGTSSLRRRTQLLQLRDDLRIVPLRGNVDTRLRKMKTEGLDAIILAMAGIKRLGIEVPNLVPISPDLLVPAVGQGSLAIEAKGESHWIKEMLSELNDPDTEAASKAERAFLRTMGGGCQVPMGALATVEGEGLFLRAILLDEPEKRSIRVEARGSILDPEALGEKVALSILAQGGQGIIQRINATVKK